LKSIFEIQYRVGTLISVLCTGKF